MNRRSSKLSLVLTFMSLRPLWLSFGYLFINHFNIRVFRQTLNLRTFLSQLLYFVESPIALINHSYIFLKFMFQLLHKFVHITDIGLIRHCSVNVLLKFLDNLVNRLVNHDLVMAIRLISYGLYQVWLIHIWFFFIICWLRYYVSVLSN